MNYFMLPGIKLNFRSPSNVNHRKDMIIDAVAQHFKVSRWTLLNVRGRRGDKVFRRQVCMFLLREDAKLHFKPIGKFFGRDHSTVIHGCRHIARLMEKHPDVSETIAAIRVNYL